MKPDLDLLQTVVLSPAETRRDVDYRQLHMFHRQRRGEDKKIKIKIKKLGSERSLDQASDNLFRLVFTCFTLDHGNPLFPPLPHERKSEAEAACRTCHCFSSDSPSHLLRFATLLLPSKSSRLGISGAFALGVIV